jgi:CTP:molybdopterin cytidylyltransferase MocA
VTAADAASGQVVGLLLAAGSGSRLGRPKALVTDALGVTWLARAVDVLRDGGCGAVWVVAGAAAEEVRRQVPPGVRVVVAGSWAEGMGASLRAGLGGVVDQEAEASAVVVMLVDTPHMTSDVVRRLLATGTGPQALGRSTYHGVPGHPVLIGRDHWAGVLTTAHGDRGARDYLADHDVLLVECGDLANGTDVDTQADLDAWLAEGASDG